jgi:hypothetical protein
VAGGGGELHGRVSRELRNRREKKDEGGLTGSPCVGRNRRLKLLRSLKKKWRGNAGVGLISEEGCDGAQGTGKRDARRCKGATVSGDAMLRGTLRARAQGD